MRLKSVPARVWLIAAGMVAVALLSVPAVLWREGPGAVIPALADGGGMYEEIVPQKLVPLKDNRPWNPNWERWPIANVPRHPLDILGSSPKDEPELRKWVEAWQERIWAGGKTDEAERQQLTELLERSGLSALAMLEAGQSFDLAEDEAAAAVWFRHGIHCAKDELSELPRLDDLHGRRLAESLILAQSLMWPAQNAGRIAQSQTFELLYRTLVPLLADGDEQKNWARIGIADSLNLQGRCAEALAHAQSCDVFEMVGEQRVGLEWAKSLALLGQERFSELVPHLREVVASRAFAHRGDARALLVIALVRTGDVMEAKQQYEPFEAGTEQCVFSGMAKLMLEGALRVPPPPVQAGVPPQTPFQVTPRSLLMRAASGKKALARLRVDRPYAGLHSEVVAEGTSPFLIQSIKSVDTDGAPVTELLIEYAPSSEAAGLERAQLCLRSGADQCAIPLLGMAVGR